MGITPHEILSFDEKHIFNNNPVNQQGGEYVAYNNTEIKQVQALYEKLLAEKDRVIRLLEKQVREAK